MRVRKIGRKFGLAVYFCAPLCVLSVLAFCHHIKEPNAPLLLTMVAGPLLVIIAGVIGVEGAKDIKVAKGDSETPGGA
jgi:hypothetical protein